MEPSTTHIRKYVLAKTAFPLGEAVFLTYTQAGVIMVCMMNKEKEVIKISVRNLVEFILRSGNLDNRRTFQADRDAMTKGSKIR